MNFLTHAIRYLDRPLVAAATGIPDWLTVADRKIRARGKMAHQHVGSSDPDLRAVACGILYHIEDDHWFHATAAFSELNLQLAVQLRDRLPGDRGFRPTFVGHILIEMLLDSLWLRDHPELGGEYYEACQMAGPLRIERCVNAITGKPTDRLAPVIIRFIEARFLYDYLEPERLLMRLNQVMNRVGLQPLPASLRGWLSAASNLVESRRWQLLTPPETDHQPFADLAPKARPPQ